MYTPALEQAADDFYNDTVSKIQENIGSFVQGHFDSDPMTALLSLINIASAATRLASALAHKADMPALPFQTK